MTREEALSLYLEIRYNLINSRHKEAVDMAFEALREREVVTNVNQYGESCTHIENNGTLNLSL